MLEQLPFSWHIKTLAPNLDAWDKKNQSEQAWFIAQKTLARAALNRKLGENEDRARGRYTRFILKRTLIASHIAEGRSKVMQMMIQEDDLQLRMVSFICQVPNKTDSGSHIFIQRNLARTLVPFPL